MNLKIIFLDFDGVINGSDLPACFSAGWPESHLETLLIERINKIVEIVEAQDAEKDIKTKIVISSSWRVRFPLDELRHMLRNKGLRAEVIDVTPRIYPMRFSENVPRGKEIQAWLTDCTDTVVKFVILDDISNMKHLSPFLILTDDRTGITEADVEKAIKMLEN